MNIETMFRRLLDRIDGLERLVSRQSVRINNLLREGQVKSVDCEKGLAVVDAHGVETKMVPWLEQAGDINEWTPPSAGQRVLLASPGGDPGKAVIMNGGYTDETRQPDNRGAHKRVRIGGATVTHSADGWVFEVGSSRLIIEPNRITIHSEEIVISAERLSMQANEVGIVGDSLTHNDRNVGDTHVHGGIFPGPANTGVPAN